jgi:hypothetical protein
MQTTVEWKEKEKKRGRRGQGRRGGETAKRKMNLLMALRNILELSEAVASIPALIGGASNCRKNRRVLRISDCNSSSATTSNANIF